MVRRGAVIIVRKLIRNFIIFYSIAYMFTTYLKRFGFKRKERLFSQEKYTRINGISVHYLFKPANTNSTNAPTIIFIHGILASCRSWDNITPHFSSFNTYAIDLLQCGLTERVNKVIHFPELADEITGFIKKMNIKNPIIVSHSLGAMVGLEVASRKENNVKALVFESGITKLPIPRYYNLIGRMFLLSPFFYIISYLVTRGILPVGQGILEKAVYNKAILTDEFKRRYGAYLLSGVGTNIARDFLSFEGYSLSKKTIQSVMCPVLVIMGDKDPLVPLSKTDIAALMKMLPDAELITFTDTGHMPHEEKRDEFLVNAYDFIISAHKHEHV